MSRLAAEVYRRMDIEGIALKILVLNGPNLQMLGIREPEVYGSLTLEEIDQQLRDAADKAGVEIDFEQTNHEGEMVDAIAASRGVYDGILINPAAYTHTSVALYDALKAVGVPAVEVHLSNTAAREEFRRSSLTAPACVGQVMGFGVDSYLLGLSGLLACLKRS